MVLTQTDELVLHKRAYLLADCNGYPLEHDLIVYDCPATPWPALMAWLLALTLWFLCSWNRINSGAARTWSVATTIAGTYA